MAAKNNINPFIYNELGQIQWFWRLLAFFPIYLILTKLIQVWFQVYDPKSADPLLETVWLTIRFGCQAAAVLLLTWIALTVLDKRRFDSFGLSFHERWTKEVVLGILLGFALTFLALGLVSLLGTVSLSAQPFDWVDLTALIVLQLILWLLASISVEAFLRGYVLQVISEAQGKIFASLFLSFLSAILYTQFRPELWIHGVNMAVWNLIACVFYFRTRTLWASIGLQASAAFFQQVFFGSPVFDIHPTFSLFHVELTGRNALTGDYFGVQQGLLAGSVLVVTLYYLIHTKQLQVADSVRKAKYEALTKPFVHLEK